MQVIVDEYKRELQKLRMELSEQVEENIRLKGFRQMVMEDPAKFEDKRTYKSLKEHANDISYENEVGLVEENKKLKKRAEEAEGENTIIKGIGQNSPEMRALQARLKELELINTSHQELNGKLRVELTELKEDNKKLAYQIEDKVNAMRKSGL